MGLGHEVGARDLFRDLEAEGRGHECLCAPCACVHVCMYVCLYACMCAAGMHVSLALLLDRAARRKPSGVGCRV